MNGCRLRCFLPKARTVNLKLSSKSSAGIQRMRVVYRITVVSSTRISRKLSASNGSARHVSERCDNALLVNAIRRHPFVSPFQLDILLNELQRKMQHPVA